MVEFLATSWACLIAMVFYYVVTPQNRILCLICLYTRSYIRSSKEYRRYLGLQLQGLYVLLLTRYQAAATPYIVLAQVVLALSDQLLVTGLAFIISGYYQPQCGLSVYHWQIITRLVRFVSVTHIATLICLEKYFEKHRYIWYVRVFLMTGLAIMLAI